jgi:hypothetical protein
VCVFPLGARMDRTGKRTDPFAPQCYLSNGKDAEREAMLPLTQNLFFRSQGKAAVREARELMLLVLSEAKG